MFYQKCETIDRGKAEEEMLYALECGVNCFDTACVYADSGIALGKFPATGYCNRVNIATKLVKL